MRWLFLCLIGFGSGMVAVAVDYSIDKVCFGLEKWEEILEVRIGGQMIYVYTDFAQYTMYTVRYLCLTYIYIHVYAFVLMVYIIC